MQKRLTLVALLLSFLLLSACQTTSPIITQPIGQEFVRVNPVNVQSDFITTQAIEPQALNISSGNLFDNSGFESGLDNWTACNAGAIRTSGDAFEGSGALEIVPNNCFYRSAEVSAGQDLILSCYVKITEGSGWTGMGMGFSNSSWTAVGEAPTTIVTSNDYIRYDVTATTPANTKFASMWLYSENKAVVDNCTLMLEQEPPPPPPPPSDNLLENGSFEDTKTVDIPGFLSKVPTNWSWGCFGDDRVRQYVLTDYERRDREGAVVSTTQYGACLDQSLSASEVSLLSGQAFTFSCYVNLGIYASMSIFLDGQPISTSVSTQNQNRFELLEINGVVPQDVSSIFVSIYGNLASFDDCSLVVGNTRFPPPPPLSENLLENANLFRSNLPVDWNLGCSGSIGGVQGNFTKLSNGCLDQSLSSSDLSTLTGQQYNFSCLVNNFGGYASMSIFFDGVPISKEIPLGPELIEIKGDAPSANDGFISIYSEGELVISDCYLRWF